MSEIRLRSDIAVSLVPETTAGDDRSLAFAAWAENPSLPPECRLDTPDGWMRTLRACMRDRHNSPFEHGMLSVYAEMPGVAWWQLTRHRFMSLDSEDFSFNLESGRYKHLDPEFYLPPDHRPMFEPDGFKPMRPTLEASAPGARFVREELEKGFRSDWRRYGELIGSNVAREVARLCLPNWALYCDGWVSARPLTWLQFFMKRNKTPDTAVPTFPQWEIEQFASKVEELFAARWPITHSLFVEFGRVAP